MSGLYILHMPQKKKKQKNPNKQTNKNQQGLNGPKTNKTGQKHLNVNKHQSEQSHLGQRFGLWAENSRTEQEEGRKAAPQHICRSETDNSKATITQRCRCHRWGSSKCLDCGSGLTVPWLDADQPERKILTPRMMMMMVVSQVMKTLLSRKAPLSKGFELRTSVNVAKFISVSWYKTEKSIKSKMRTFALEHGNPNDVLGNEIWILKKVTSLILYIEFYRWILQKFRIVEK